MDKNANQADFVTARLGRVELEVVIAALATLRRMMEASPDETGAARVALGIVGGRLQQILDRADARRRGAVAP